ncbi:uncharacterized protein N7477_009413 [Penicillium maclennaniae]|uniref:uncharacterized protein n=1 Tax=Penicillium maclennaniae TaxID=1343394 RepID=UPI0025401F47|nr:uncharacterized protein N7477_009413 [Penicillium maclennaniae]KAJ5661797.1 hypothetical protein N7477_009413 [Penicillium maclennaniae]
MNPPGLGDFDLSPALPANFQEDNCCLVNYTADDVDDAYITLFALQWEPPDWFRRARLDEELFNKFDVLKEYQRAVD